MYQKFNDSASSYRIKEKTSFFLLNFYMTLKDNNRQVLIY